MLLFYFLFIVATSIVGAIPFEDCGSEYLLEKVNVENCTTLPCHLYVGKEVPVHSTFYAEFASLSWTTDVHFLVNSVQEKVEALQDSCTQGTNECYVYDGQTKQYHAVMKVNNDLPPVRAQLVWKLINEQGRNIVCFKVDIAIMWESM